MTYDVAITGFDLEGKLQEYNIGYPSWPTEEQLLRTVAEHTTIEIGSVFKVEMTLRSKDSTQQGASQ